MSAVRKYAVKHEAKATRWGLVAAILLGVGNLAGLGYLVATAKTGAPPPSPPAARPATRPSTPLPELRGPASPEAIAAVPDEEPEPLRPTPPPAPIATSTPRKGPPFTPVPVWFWASMPASWTSQRLVDEIGDATTADIWRVARTMALDKGLEELEPIARAGNRPVAKEHLQGFVDSWGPNYRDLISMWVDASKKTSAAVEETRRRAAEVEAGR